MAGGPHPDYRILARILDAGVLPPHAERNGAHRYDVCISEVVDVRSDILIDFLVVLVRVVDMVPPSSPLRGCLSS